MTKITITGEDVIMGEREPGAITVRLGDTGTNCLWQSRTVKGPLTIELPGLTGIRIDPERRIIAIDGLDGTADAPLFPEYVVHDLRSGVYGGFHRLRPRDECFDPAGCADATDPAAREHVGDTTLNGCTCEQQAPGENPICDHCQQIHAEVVIELYATDPRFREELDKWHHVDSPEGQAILAQLDGQVHD